MNKRWFLLCAALALLASACTPEPSSSVGFRLPPGDVERGRVAFVELQCNSCHTVIGLDLARPVADPPVGVDLGGIVARRRTDGELVTSIIHPDHKISTRFAGGQVEVRGHTRMGDFTDTMTVRQMVDLVAFLQSRYEVQEPASGL